MTTNQRDSQRGGVAIYVLLLFPVALTLTSIAFDVSGWNALRDELQKEADRIALQAASALPDRNAASDFARQAIAQLPLPGLTGELSFPEDKPSALAVTLRVTYRSTFDTVLRNAAPSATAAFKVERTGIAQPVPTDAVLIMADGSSLRPGLVIGNTPQETQANLAWGSAGEWPESGYFRCTTPPRLAAVGAIWDWWNRWNVPEFQRWATQACFNPTLSALKLAAINFVDSTLASPADRLAVIFTPGDTNGRGYFPARHIHEESEDAERFRGQLGGFPRTIPGTAEAHWGNYQELERLISDEVCMLIAHPRATVGTPYELHASPYERVGSPESCDDPLQAMPCGREHSPRGNLRSCYLSEALSAREAIYWHAARLALPGASATPDIRAALQQAWNELLGAGSQAATTLEQAKRGNLALSAIRRVVVLTDFLPDPNDGSPTLVELLSAYSAQHIHLTLVVFAHEGLSDLDRATLNARLGELQNLTTDENLLRIFSTADANELQEIIGPMLPSLGRQYAIRR